MCRTFVNRPVARGLLPGRADFVVVATQLAEAGVPARSIHRGRFWGMRYTAPRHTPPPRPRPRLTDGKPGQAG